MTNRIATIEISNKTVTGKFAVYHNCSTLNPGYLVRCGPPLEDWTDLLRVKGRGYKLVMEVDTDLKVRFIHIFGYPNNTSVPHKTTESIANMILRRLASQFNKEYKTTRIPKQKKCLGGKFSRLRSKMKKAS